MSPAQRRALQLGCGLLLIAIAVFGGVQAVRAGWAQHLYWRVKYGDQRGDVDAILRKGSVAHGVYPYNHNLCMWVAEHALSRAASVGTPAGTDDPYALVQEWCERGLSLNPYPRRMRFIKMYLIRRISPEEALQYWNEYVEWQFWEPYNHAVLVDLYAACGQLVEAEDSLRWVEGSPHFPAAKQRLAQARKGVQSGAD